MTFHLIFVYGTLKVGFANHSYWLDDDAVRYVSEGLTRDRYHMSVTSNNGAEVKGNYAPWITVPSEGGHGGGCRVFGELMAVRDDRLAALDILERHYDRTLVKVDRLDDGTTVNAYVYMGKKMSEGPPISRYLPDVRYIPPQLRPGGNGGPLSVAIPRGGTPRLCLVITADDFGVNKRRTDGVLEAARAGAVTQAQLMVNGACPAYAADGAAGIRTLSLGLHINLTEGVPVTPTPSSLAPAGRMLGKFGLRDALVAGAIDLRDVAAEVTAQLLKFNTLVGAMPTHCDGHHHVHVHPAVVGVIAAVLAAHGVRSVRLPLDVFPDTFTDPFHAVVCREASAARDTLASHSLTWPDAFTGLSMMGHANTIDRMYASLVGMCRMACLSSTGHSVGEIMTHVGHPAERPPADAVGVEPFHYDEFSQDPARAHELALYTSGAWRDALRVHQVPLVGVGTLVGKRSKM